MAKYRYLFYDLMSNRPTIEMDLYGTYFERELNISGNGSATCKVLARDDESTGLSADDVNGGTEPGRTKLYVERDGRIVWAGIVWSRTWQEQSKTYQFSLQTLNSFFYRKIIETSLVVVGDPRNIVMALVNHMQSYPANDIGIVVPATFPEVAIRSINFNQFEGWSYGRAIDFMLDYDKGLDFEIDSTWGPDGHPIDTLRIDTQLGSSSEDTQLTFDYPGNISNFWYSESAARGATSIVGFGSGEGTEMKQSKYTHEDLIAGGFPNLELSYINKDVSEQDTLDRYVLEDARLRKAPVITPTIELAADTVPGLESIGLGDYCKAVIDSVRFSRPITIQARIVGFQLRPTGSRGPEEVKLIIPGNEVSE